MATETPAQGVPLDKTSDNFVEEKDIGSSDPARFLSESHKEYLIERHGTCDLDPTPSMDPADPYNWPLWKVRKNHHHKPGRMKSFPRPRYTERKEKNNKILNQYD